MSRNCTWIVGSCILTCACVSCACCSQVRAKAYNMEAIHSAASEGKLTPLQDKHDLRGVPALLEHYKSSPAVLEPQALTRPK